MHSSQTFINIFNFYQREAEIFSCSGKNPKSAFSNPVFERVSSSSSLQKGLLCSNPCGIFQGILEAPSCAVLPSGLGLCPGVSLAPCPKSFPFQIQMSNVAFLVPTWCSHLLFLFFFSMFPWLDCNREEENEVSKTNSNVPGSAVSPAGLVWLRHSVNPEPPRGWMKQMDAF